MTSSLLQQKTKGLDAGILEVERGRVKENTNEILIIINLLDTFCNKQQTIMHQIQSL